MSHRARSPASRRWVAPCARALAIVSLALLSACETTPPVVRPVADPGRVWAGHRARVVAIDHWTAAGQVGVRNGHEGWSASLFWRQSGAGYRIRLSGPLGQGAVQVDGRPGRVVVLTADNRKLTAATPDEILSREAGLTIPVSGLRYWIMGVPAPGAAVTALDLDPAGRLQRLEQSGWTIRYTRYERFGDLDLPTAMAFERGDVSARIAVHDWAFGA